MLHDIWQTRMGLIHDNLVCSARFNLGLATGYVQVPNPNDMFDKWMKKRTS